MAMPPARPYRGYWGMGVFHTKTYQNIGTLLRSAHSFGADFVSVSRTFFV